MTKEFTIKSSQFDWNNNFSEVAIEDFDNIRDKLSYGTCQSIGMALAKLEILEKQGCKVEESNSRMINKEKKYRAIALDLLDRYIGAEETVCSEFSGDFYKDRLRLERVVREFLVDLDAEDKYEEITNGKWIFEVEE